MAISKPRSATSAGTLTADLDSPDDDRLAGVEVHADRLPVQHVEALLERHRDVLPLALRGEGRPGAVLQPHQLLALVVLRLSAAHSGPSVVADTAVVNGGGRCHDYLLLMVAFNSQW